VKAVLEPEAHDFIARLHDLLLAPADLHDERLLAQQLGIKLDHDLRACRLREQQRRAYDNRYEA
jgi:hypothetical protein